MKNPVLQNFASLDEFHSAATGFIVDHLNGNRSINGRTTLFLSGGSTPGTIYKMLSAQNLDWSSIDVAQVDDRWVGLSDPGSNASMIKRTLLKNQARSAKFFRIKSRHKTAVSGHDKIESVYRQLAIKSSLAILGMGMDGHVCSWFPGAKGLALALDPSNENRTQAIVANRSEVTGPYLERMTLTLSALVQCGSLLLLIKGANKKALLEKAIRDRSDRYPVSHLLNAVGDRLQIMCTE